MSKFDLLGVYLAAGAHEVRVGSLVRDESGIVRFDIDEAYIELGQYRPILSSSLLRYGDEDQTIALLRDGSMRKPGRDIHPWFANLLPEGALKDLVLRGMPTGSTTDFDVLRWLGGDLPGAVLVRGEEANPLPATLPTEPSTTSSGIRFSLAGVQLKMSMQKQDQRLTIPAIGGIGDIIAKLPSERYRCLPEVEYSSMMLAKAVGVEVPDFELVPISDLVGVEAGLLKGGDLALAVKRFDRQEGGRRVHVEDFLQVLGDQPDRKYSAANEETIMAIATRLGGGTQAFLQSVRRVAANILMGNTDAHTKNWSLWYPTPCEGQLSPAYDIVASVVYDPSDKMALRFRGTHDSHIITSQRFQRAASLCGVPEKRATKEVRHVVEQAADEWRNLLQDMPMPEDYAKTLIARAQTLALTKEFESECSKRT
ncbi:type II toxin-antitoxin system HipA family toxin [Rhizobium sp. 3T7]|uniref:type II toxin-antitoxin system HipA family toxin n=1 Tax=Rhizobium sp. 3T7 TaxID=2874922 RepID=UPI001CCBB025|nr:type II toxin-antitoxin system HipA family toxin [Rhizobium sp. 3T7]MBZ9792002.1 type II toxin-antitoxin system HipA family toxin [Rhizobium sp. 3T7]